MSTRILLLAAALVATILPAHAQRAEDAIAAPTLRANVTVTSDLVRVGDVIDNAGVAASIPIYRSPDLGTTGTLPVAQVIAALRAKQVIGVDTHDLREITVTRLARNLPTKELEQAVAAALEHRFGLGEATNLNVSFDRGISDMRLEASNTGTLQAGETRYDPRNGRFDITFDIAREGAAPTRLRLTGTAIETIEVAVLTRDIERPDVLKASDLALTRRPKAEVTGETVTRERAVGMLLRRPMRSGTPVRVADLARPEFVQRDQSVTVIYQMPGLYLTTRGKAMENGAEGDVVSVLNPQSKRTITGVVTGRGQVTIQSAPAAPVAEMSSLHDAPVAVASNQISPAKANAE